MLRQAGVTTALHFAAFDDSLKSIHVNRRRGRDRATRLLALAQGSEVNKIGWRAVWDH